MLAPEKSSNSGRLRVMEWGTLEWFSNKFMSQGTEDPAAYFAHKSSGYHQYRHKCLAGYLRGNSAAALKGNLLDIGCGTGDLTALVFREHHFKEAWGIDFVEPVIKQAQKSHPDIQFEVGTLPELRFPDNKFDVVVASEVFYYLNSEERLKALKEISRVLKENGLLLFSSVLGEQYFSAQRAQDFVKNYFTVEKVWHDNNKIYRFLTSPLIILNNLNYNLYAGTEPTNPKLLLLYEKYAAIFSNPLFRQFLRITCKMLNPVLRSERLPFYLGWLSKKLCPSTTQTNITILARKSTYDHGCSNC